MTDARRQALRLYATAVIAYAADRLTKVWVVHALAGRPPVTIIPRVLHLRYTTNSGGAFGVGQSASWLFAGATIVVSIAIIVASLRPLRPLAAVALGLVLGGALGNLTDRVLRGDGFFSGRVVDFIDFRVWPVFNLADSAIVIGALLLALASFRHEEE